MKRLLVLLVLWAVPAWAQGPEVKVNPATEFIQAFTASGNGTCREVVPGVGYHTIRWVEVGTISAGTVKLEGSNDNCVTVADIISAQAITSSGAIVATAGVYTHVRMVVASMAGTGNLQAWYGGYKDISAAAVTVGDVTNSGTFAVQCTSGCSGGTSDTDDATIAAGQSTGLTLGLNQVFDGTNWKRMTIGTAGTASAQVLTVQGITSMTPLLATVSDGAGALNVIVDSGTITAVTTITNAVTVTDGAGALNVICDSGCAGGTQYTEDAAAAANPVGNAQILVRADTPAASVTTDGDNIAARGTDFGAMYVTLLNQAGAYALSTDSADNAAMSAPPVLVAGGYVAAPADHSDGDAATLLTDIKGRQVVVGAGTAGTATGGVLTIQGVASMTAVQVTVNTFPDNEPINVAQINGVTVLMGNGASGTGAQRVTLANDSTGVVGLNAGSNLIGKVDIQIQGTAVTAVTDPCDGTTKSQYTINLSSAGTVEIANAAGASQIWHICGIDVVTTAANSILIATDDTDGCGSLTAGMNGGTTAATGWPFAANGGISKGDGSGTIMKSSNANHYLCLAMSASTQTSGSIQYVTAVP